MFGDGVALEQADLDALGFAIIGTGQDDTLAGGDGNDTVIGLAVEQKGSETNSF